MTNHVAVTYFDEETSSFGYVIGADSLSGTLPCGDDQNITRPEELVDKYILGNRTVGFLRGIFYTSACSLTQELRQLDGVFDNIDEGTVYDDILFLLYPTKYVALVAKQDGEQLSLYTVSNQRESNVHHALLIDTIDRHFFETASETKVIFSPGSVNYAVLKSSERWSLEKATENALFFLERGDAKLKNLDGSGNLFNVKLSGIEQLINGEFKPIHPLPL